MVRPRPLLLVAAAMVLAAGCVTPSIPVPPPDPQAMSFALDTTAGSATFSYAGNPNLGGATVYVFDRNKGKGVIDTARPSGAVGPTDAFPASAGDEVDVSFQLGDQASSICVLLKAGAPSSFCP